MRIRGVQLLGNWTASERAALESALAPVPKHWLESNPGIRSIARQPRLQNAPKDAPGHSRYDPQEAQIVVFDKGMYHREKIDEEQLRRSVYHELCHAFLRDRPELLDSWQAKTRRDGFVDEYAKTSPAEDICDTFSEYLLHRDKTLRIAPKKAAFIKRLLTSEVQKTAMYMINAFSDELNKTATASTSLLKRIGQAATSKKALLGYGGAGAAASAKGGYELGQDSGLSEGRKDVMVVANRARAFGQREGANHVINMLRRNMRAQRQQAANTKK